ncbi:MAG: DUF6677 family protein [Candidatus Aminicenantales bacterium]
MSSFLSRAKPYLFFGLAWAFPGLGHFLQKRIFKGLLFCFGILALLLLGLQMGGQIGMLYDFQPYTIIKFIGGVGSGLFFAAVKLAGLGAGNPLSPAFDFGTTYLVSAGLINFLIAFNAFEVARAADRV